MMASYAPVVAAAQLPPPVSGLTAVNAEMISRLRARGVLSEYVDLSPGSHRASWRRLATRVKRLMGAPLRLTTARSRGAKAFYMPSDGGIGIAGNILLSLISRVLRYRLYIHHHSFAYIDRRSWLMAALISTARRGTVHIGLCELMVKRLQATYPAEWAKSRAQHRTLSNAFMVPMVSVPPERNHRSITLGHLSNLTADKGTLRFLELFEELCRRGVEVRGHIAGPIHDPEVGPALDKALIRHSSRLKWLGPLHGEAKQRFYREIDIFVFPTTYKNEAQPLVLLEAMSHGCPIATIGRGCISCDHDESVGFVAHDADHFSTSAADFVQSLASAPARFFDFQMQALAHAESAHRRASVQIEAIMQEMTT